MKEEKKNSKQIWAGVLISGVCLAAIFFFIEPAQIWESLKNANYGYLLLTALGIVLFLAFRAWRWRFMLENEVLLVPAFHIQNIGYLVNNFLPLRLGDVTQAVLIGSVPPITIARGLSSVVATRIFDMMFIVLLLPITLSQVETVPDQVQSVALITGILMAILIVMLIVAANQRPFARKLSTIIFTKTSATGQKIARWSGKKMEQAKRPFLYKFIFFISNGIGKMDVEAWVRRVDDFLVGLSSLTHLKSGSILIISTVILWLPIIGAYYAGMFAVNLQPTWIMAAFVVCAAALSVAAPSSPGQVGVYHAGVIFALSGILGQPEAESASFAFLYHATNLIVMTLMGIIGLLATGATFQHVINTSRQYLTKKDDESDKQLSHPPV
jgi:uncharacterized protein (TIRG00374 family)